MNKTRWLLPATASLAFLVFSIVVAAREGLFGFLVEHQRNGWGVQIAIDLVTATVVALSFIAPVARRAGVRMTPWVVLTVCTGSIGLLALVARVLYMQAKPTGPAADRAAPLQTGA